MQAAFYATWAFASLIIVLRVQVLESTAWLLESAEFGNLTELQYGNAISSYRPSQSFRG